MHSEITVEGVAWQIHKHSLPLSWPSVLCRTQSQVRCFYTTGSAGGVFTPASPLTREWCTVALGWVQWATGMFRSIVILRSHHHVLGPSLTKTSLCDVWLCGGNKGGIRGDWIFLDTSWEKVLVVCHDPASPCYFMLGLFQFFSSRAF